MKKIMIIAGPNGAGKTTFARAFLPAEAQCPHFVNADLIAAGLSPFAPELAAMKAGRLMLREMSEYAVKDESFAFETTLSGLGYFCSIFVGGERKATVVAERVRQDGHDVPEPVIRRRFAAGLRNFEHHYRHEVDDWALYDNSAAAPTLLEWGENT